MTPRTNGLLAQCQLTEAQVQKLLTESEETMNGTKAIQAGLKTISDHTSHLSKLDNISKTLVRAFVAQTMLTIVFFGAIVLVVLLGDHGKLTASSSGIQVEKGSVALSGSQ